MFASFYLDLDEAVGILREKRAFAVRTAELRLDDPLIIVIVAHCSVINDVGRS